MKLEDFPLFLDENIHPAVQRGLAEQGWDVSSVRLEGLVGLADDKILDFAVSTGRVVVTHDSDFGTLAVRGGQELVGIVYLRPGHFNPTVVLNMMAVVNSHDTGITPPFIVVAELRMDLVKVRFRQLLPL